MKLQILMTIELGGEKFESQKMAWDTETVEESKRHPAKLYFDPCIPWRKTAAKD